MNVVLAVFSGLLLVTNYLTYKGKISILSGGVLVLAGEIGGFFSLYLWQGYHQDLLITGSLVLLFSMFALILPRFIPNLQNLIWLEIMFLVQAGSLLLYRISASLAIRHIIICLVGLCLIFPVYLVVKHFPTAFRYGPIYFALAAILLLINNKTQFGARNWTQIGNIVYQPSEFVKILFSMFLASYLLKQYSFLGFIKSSLMSIFIIGILVWQKDLGGAFIFFTIYVVITYMYSHNKWILALQFMASLTAALASIFFFPHVKVRIISWLYPFEHAQNEGFQLVRSLQALMNGKWWGTGLGFGHPERIPVVTSDFLFAAMGEEYGAIYLLLFVLHFMFLILLLYNQCLKSRNKFYFYTGTSLTTMLAIQAYLIMAGSSGMIPLTGVVLPFVSYGGSAMIGNFLIVAMIENMTKLNHVGRQVAQPMDLGGQDQVKVLSKYVRMLKYFIFIIYSIFLIYLVYLYSFWLMPSISKM